MIVNSTFQGDAGPVGEPGPRGPDGRIVSHINYLNEHKAIKTYCNLLQLSIPV